MAPTMNFRSAFHGFNREDVVHYIEYLTAKHSAQISELNAEIEFLRSKAELQPLEAVTSERLIETELQRDEYKEQLDLQAAYIRELEAQCDSTARKAGPAPQEDSATLELAGRCTALEQELAEALAAKEAAENSRDDALAAKEAAEKARDEAIAARDAAESARNAQPQHSLQELEAYRRAERTERIARERAEQLYHKANGALADATARVDDAAVQIGEMTDKVMEQLQLLQQAVTGSRQALTDAAGTMYSIRPSGTDE